MCVLNHCPRSPCISWSWAVPKARSTLCDSNMIDLWRGPSSHYHIHCTRVNGIHAVALCTARPSGFGRQQKSLHPRPTLLLRFHHRTVFIHNIRLQNWTPGRGLVRPQKEKTSHTGSEEVDEWIQTASTLLSFQGLGPPKNTVWRPSSPRWFSNHTLPLVTKNKGQGSVGIFYYNFLLAMAGTWDMETDLAAGLCFLPRKLWIKTGAVWDKVAKSGDGWVRSWACALGQNCSRWHRLVPLQQMNESNRWYEKNLCIAQTTKLMDNTGPCSDNILKIRNENTA